MKTIWFDIDNSPHVLLFKPIINILKSEGYNIIVTARNFAQTLPLLEKYNIPYIRVDGHGGKSKVKKVFTTLKRAYGLYKVLKGYKIDLMVNHGARAGIIAAKMLGIPIISGFDYEYNEITISLKLSDIILVPIYLREKFYLNKKVRFYDGLKEEVYLCGANFNSIKSEIYKEHNFIKDLPLAIFRPPSLVANYHNSKSDLLFKAALEYLLSSKECNILYIPRTNEDKLFLKKFSDITRYGQRFAILENKVYDAKDLIWSADLVISGGGTMIREAAILGVPAYSIFASKIGGVDLSLEKMGKITIIRDISDINKIKTVSKDQLKVKPLIDCKVRNYWIEIIKEQLKNL